LRGLEFLIAFFVLLGIMMGYTAQIPGGHFVLMIGCGTLAIFYIILAFGLGGNFFIARLRNAEPDEKPYIWMRLLYGLTFTLATVSIYWHERFLPMATTLVYLSTFLLTVTMFLAIYLFEKNDPAMYRFIMFRSIVFSAMVIFYVLTPLPTRLAWRFEDQYYRELLQYSIENPDDPQAKKNVRDYERKSRGEIFIEEEVE